MLEVVSRPGHVIFYLGRGSDRAPALVDVEKRGAYREHVRGEGWCVIDEIIDPTCPPAPDPVRVFRYRVAAKLGPWFRCGARAVDHWLTTGSQGKPVYKRITDVRKTGNPYFLAVQTEGSLAYHGHGVTTNVYERY